MTNLIAVGVFKAHYLEEEKRFLLVGTKQKTLVAFVIMEK
jgi:hypothetical protein